MPRSPCWCASHNNRTSKSSKSPKRSSATRNDIIERRRTRRQVRRTLVMGKVTGRLLAAMNAHDVDAFVDCFAPDYRSEQPAHPGRAFEGSDKVRENWTSVF